MQIDVLAFGAHPDDVELFAGGTLARLASRGRTTGIVDLTRGELGTRGTPELRAEEAREAARHLKLSIRESLDLPDGSVVASPEARLALVRALREYRPRIVLTHYWEDRHPDHVATSLLVAAAAHHAGLARIDTGQERFRPAAVLYFKLPPGRTPSFVVDVSEFASERRAAIAAYRSQLFDSASREPGTYLSRPDFLAQIESIHAYYGALIGKPMGEAFYVKNVMEIADPVDVFHEAVATGLF
jgi:bacillithiol biosynthesis deacetylase BshB1